MTATRSVATSPISTFLREMTAEDWPAVRRIYEEGIATRNATFETESPDWPDWDRTTSHAGSGASGSASGSADWTAGVTSCCWSAEAPSSAPEP